MSSRSSRFVLMSIGLVLACAIGACQSTSKSGSAAGVPSAKVNPAPLQAQAKQPPPSNATQKTSIGQGKMAVQTANKPGDTDSYWVQQFDIDGDGDMEQTDFLWDDEDKVLYAYAQTEVACSFGGTAVVAILAGVNGAGNSHGRPAGSGFYAVYFDGTECGAAAAGLYGCKFDAAGNATAWAGAVVDSFGDEIDFVGMN